MEKKKEIKVGDSVKVIDIHPKDAFYSDERFINETAKVLHVDNQYIDGFFAGILKFKASVPCTGSRTFFAVKVKKVRGGKRCMS